MTVRVRRPLVVVGGGAAGLAAASAARDAGLEAVVIAQGHVAAPHGVEILGESIAWGIWGHELAVCTPAEPRLLITFDQLILATGSYERPAAFPGWDLPGVLSARGARRLAEQGVAAGSRVVVAGFAEFVDEAAQGLAHVVDVVDARAGRMVVRADGDASLERVVIARVDADWCPGPEEETVEADALVLAFGTLPENQLARLAGCAFAGSEFVRPIPARDEWLRSSVAGVFIVEGPDEGRLAGIGAALDAGLLTTSEAERRRGETPRHDLPEAPRSGFYTQATDDTLICRCEDVTALMIKDRILAGSLEPGPVIAESRAGMGPCQGRNCVSQVAAVIARSCGVSIETMPAITPRPPVVPVPVGALAERPAEFGVD